jgi:sugar phosphate isomerase/epimerase
VERFFNECKCDNVGIEWDASHLMCQLVDPVTNIHKFGSRIFHVHAKDAFINRQLLEAYGICHHGVAEHRSPGFGQANWPEIIHALLRAGYDSDLNIEGRTTRFCAITTPPPVDITLASETRRRGRSWGLRPAGEAVRRSLCRGNVSWHKSM